MFFSLSSELPNTITVISSSGNNLYFGGYSNSFFSPSVTRYLNGSLQTLLYEMDLMDWNSTPPRILDIYADINSGNLYIAGQIQQTPMNGTTWNSLLEYNVISGQSSAFNLFDSTISSVFVFEGELIVGGPFTGVGPSWNNQPLNHFARLYTPTAINTLKENLALKVFPNPTDNAITIDLGQEYVDASIEVSNALGQSIYQKEYTSTNSINLSLEGESGLYLVKVKTEDSESILKVVKQ